MILFDLHDKSVIPSIQVLSWVTEWPKVEQAITSAASMRTPIFEFPS